ncbi:HlyD family type I secretion periplasmic adaptor subunit [Paracraurococcus lichenis]|uniref:Membrane fusion protein (MFP) family protein n=1 Tax=Paracraurococcus lichenis TaxID=3064888 RepID=A0ABT9E9E8_9PROT|nr:HlyD family type I secretion periplasmic adaptor subunit [Paracraurococcus sp. LOR1-02]MDO9712724.1 HlyD family type I secretion periplasmic adaptor subunit [Paracraurococcus sp. LOR1-02]
MSALARTLSPQRLTVVTAGAVLGGLTLWGAIARLDVVSNAVGEVMPVSGLQSVQHLAGGIVREILVQPSASVTRGQPLVLLDTVRSQAELQELSLRMDSLTMDIARWEAEAEGREAFVPPVLANANPALAATAQDIFKSRRERLAHDVAIQKNLVAQRQQELQEVRTRVSGNTKAIGVLQDQVKISSELLQRGLSSRLAHLDLVRQQQILRSQLDTDTASIPRLEAAIAEARERRSGVEASDREVARRELAKARQSQDELGQRLLALKSTDEQTVLRAPVDGIVKTVAVSTLGGVIQPGQMVVELVPAADKLVIEARLPLQDIGFINEGQDARVTLNSPDAALFGHIGGTVDTVSPDATVVKDGSAFYRVRIVSDSSSFHAGDHAFRLYPGMSVICRIRTGSRSILNYVLGPWAGSLRYAFQER